ncbi:MAG TPA: maleylpyruvate isomerase family mycothiol-dependent enzyme [Pseudonocardiaceae bacterium]|nr:maleylpyruvate isomerase family mycothiol-dependent enzyme [Pseudonocardiaceae bacterium]
MNSALNKVKEFLLGKCPGLDDIDEDFELIENRVIDSLSFVTFVFLIEETSGESIDMNALRIDDFRTLRRIGERYFGRSPETVPERVLRVERASLLPMLRGAPADAFDRPTVCVGWSVRDVLAHCAGALTGLAGEPDYVASHERNQSDVELRRARPVGLVLDELEHGLATAGPVIAAAGGTKDLAALGTWIHGGDVRDALGEPDAYASAGADDALTLLVNSERVARTPLVRLTLADREITLGIAAADRGPASLSTDLATLFRLYTGRPAKPDRYELRGATLDELVSADW